MNIQGFLDDAIKRLNGELDGKALTRPTLLRGDGVGSTYAIDVAIPGQTEPLRNVPIALAAKEVHYADINSAVSLKVNRATGKFEVVGFAKTVPGSFYRFSVDLTTYSLGAMADVGLTSRVLTYYELQVYGVFGIIPYGSYALFQGTTFIRLGT